MKIQPLPLLLFILLVSIFISCSHTVAVYQETGQRKLLMEINSEIRASGLKPNLGIKVVSLKTGEVLYALNSDHLFTPASNNKIYTAIASLKILSPQYCFETTVWIDSSYISDSYAPSLTIKGAGDPDFYPVHLEKIANDIAENISLVDKIIVDNSIFDEYQYGNGWMWDEGSGWYAAQVDALSLNDNCIDISIKPGIVGEPPLIKYYPNTSYVSIHNRAITVEDTTDFEELEIERHWWNGSNIIDITGNVLKSEEDKTYYCNIDNPAFFTGTVLKEFLIKRGIAVSGPVVPDTLSDSSHLIAKHISEPLRDAIINLLKNSDNLTAELLVKTIGLNTTGRQGSWASGLHEIKIFLNDETEIDTTAMVMTDGSGVSRYNLTSPDHLVRALKYAYHDFTLNAEFMVALPTGGWDGTLQSRMRSEEINRRIRAKTGTLAGVSCLSGYALSKDEEPLAFSIMMDGYAGDADPYRKLQDDICTILTTYSRR